jgi:hypothetical protein
MAPKLVAEHIRGISQFRGYFGNLHANYYIGLSGKGFRERHEVLLVLLLGSF